MPAKQPNPIVIIKNVRLSYLQHLWEPKPPDADQPKTAKSKYEATAILDKVANAADIKAIEAAIAQVRKDPVLKGKPPTKVCLRKGDDTPVRAEAPELGSSKMTISARNTRKPAIKNRNLEDVGPEDAQAPYAGCYGDMKFEVYPYYHPKSGPGIAASLIAVQFRKDGEPFGAAPATAEGMEAIPDEQVDEGV